MTPIESILAAPRAAEPFSLVGQTIGVCWASQAAGPSGNGRRRFMLKIEFVSLDHAYVEARIEEHGGGSRSVLGRQRLPVATLIEDCLLHIDVIDDNGDGRIAAISVPIDERVRGQRPLYARTALLAQAGFSAGMYDPPTLMRWPGVA